RELAGTAGLLLVRLVFFVRPDGDEFKFESKIVGGSVPKEYIHGVKKGIESVLSSGPLVGFPMLGVKATLIDGAFHDVDSSV
ncbi:elongation factor G, partial [Rhizobium leguminosarum]